jgi:ubiquinone/menaquinone biosynthesis C-methylase UbiE
MESTKYVHGYTSRESIRLNDQANTLEEIIHHDTIFPKGSLILEAGCGVGAQTKIMASGNPGSKFISVDISEDSLMEAEKLIRSLNITNVEFEQADIYKLPFKDEVFDDAIVCFVLEHLNNPVHALHEVMRVLKKGGNLIAVEGDHGSAFFHPDSEFATAAIQCLVQLQKQKGGNANIGRELYPLLNSVGLENVSVSPRVVYADSSKPHLVEGFTRNTFTAMIEGVAQEAFGSGMMSKKDFEQGIQDLYRTAEEDGTFIYMFFKGSGIK